MVFTAQGAALGALLWGAGMMIHGVPLHALRHAIVPDALLERQTG